MDKICRHVIKISYLMAIVLGIKKYEPPEAHKYPNGEIDEREYP